MSAHTLAGRVNTMVLRGATDAEILTSIGDREGVRTTIARARSGLPTTCCHEAERDLSGWRAKQARAGILHLVDIKRAGHSPRFTEFRIPPDREQGARIVRPLAPVSYTGSHF